MFNNSVLRLWSSIVLLLIVLSACSFVPQDDPEVMLDNGEEILNTAIENMQNLASFRIGIVQGGTPYRFYFQLGPTGLEFVTVMSRAEGAFVAPDNIWANAHINVRGFFVNVGLFATSYGQWLKPLSADWVAYEYAPGFDPAEMMAGGNGLQRAISRLQNIEFIGREERNGHEVLHVRGNADSETINTMLFGLLTVHVLEELAVVDLYIDTSVQLPTELVLTLPKTATDETEDTFWQIELYDLNQQIPLEHPSDIELVIQPPVESINQPPVNINEYLGWLFGLSALLGAIGTPALFRRRGRSAVTGFFAGGLAGGIGSLFLLLPLWLLLPSRIVEGATEPVQQGSSTEKTDAADVNPWVVMGFIAIPVFVGSLDMTVVSAFLPELVSELGLPFDTGLDDASWVVTAYLLAYTVSLTFMGRLSDLLGRRAVYIASLLVFILGSVWVAIAHAWPTDLLYQFYRQLGQRPDPGYINLQVIIIGRIISALGAGALVPVSLALVGDIFPPKQRARPLGFIAAMDTLGWVLGPVYGGIFMQIMPWQGLFWMNVPLTLLSLFSVLYALRSLQMMKAKGGFDFIGTVLIVGSLIALSIGLGANVDLTGGHAGIEDLRPLPSYAPQLLSLSAALLLGFIWVETRTKDPLIYLGMFKRRNLAAASVVNLLVGYCLFIGLVSVPLLVNIRQDDMVSLSQAALEVGVLLSTLTLPMAMAAVPGGWLSDRIGVRSTILWGLGLSIAGFLVMWQTWEVDLPNLFLAAQMAVVGIGIGLTFSPVSAAIINSAYDEERGVASALVIILRLIGMTVSISTLSSVMFYRVNSMAADLANATGGFDPNALLVIYTDSAIQVLGEMGLIGAVLSGIALIPALMIEEKIEIQEID